MLLSLDEQRSESETRFSVSIENRKCKDVSDSQQREKVFPFLLFLPVVVQHLSR